MNEAIAALNDSSTDRTVERCSALNERRAQLLRTRLRVASKVALAELGASASDLASKARTVARELEQERGSLQAIAEVDSVRAVVFAAIAVVTVAGELAISKRTIPWVFDIPGASAAAWSVALAPLLMGWTFEPLFAKMRSSRIFLAVLIGVSALALHSLALMAPVREAAVKALRSVARGVTAGVAPDAAMMSQFIMVLSITLALGGALFATLAFHDLHELRRRARLKRAIASLVRRSEELAVAAGRERARFDALAAEVAELMTAAELEAGCFLEEQSLELSAKLDLLGATRPIEAIIDAKLDGRTLAA